MFLHITRLTNISVLFYGYLAIYQFKIGRTIDNIVLERMWKLHYSYLKQNIGIVTELNTWQIITYFLFIFPLSTLHVSHSFTIAFKQ